MFSRILLLITGLLTYISANAETALPELVKQIKPSVVGIGMYEPLGSPRSQLNGSGFVIADGHYVATNYHVVDQQLDPNRNQSHVVFIGQGEHPKLAKAEIVAFDAAHDIAILKMSEKAKPFIIASDNYIDDGTDVAFTGFPIGAILGLYPATHRGVISALTPVVIPSANAKQLSIEMMKRLREPYFVYQMDATAFPGNSGSPVYELNNGQVVAIINKVFVQRTKEAAITDPSGISYAIPVKYLRELAKSINIEL
ncbi:S1 family peptidase [Neptunicella marina]|uniref:Trypsin-like peptidase domain-containing protein n=1 Tax=Neptunicella marina TaxID=2125989 RepID=A0A8J6IU16_9ALTE|nr:serine protease [Neptunicella marina]MBC3765792.1 trypsin-like peptidase domain-containing protein [Neptunicella marina]